MKKIRVIPKKHREAFIDASEDLLRAASKIEKFVHDDEICPKDLQKSLRKIYLELHGNSSYFYRLSIVGT